MKMTCCAVCIVMISGCIPQPIYHSVKNENEKSNQKFFSFKTDTASRKTDYDGSGISKEGRDAMMSEIRSWMGTPYRLGMVEKGKGTDCSGFVGYVFRKTVNVDLPRETKAMFAAGESVAEKNLKFGDLVYFQSTYKGSQGPSHVGIYVGEKKMAHASTTVGVTISDLSETYYMKHFLGYRRIMK